jgi:TolB-like protein/cytochrome c-type biogenesis protein CcmH/NrfG
VAVAALGVWQYPGIHELLVRGGGAPIKLAVLPFENLTGDPEQDYLSDGLTDEIITQLGRVHPQGLRVIARTSTMRYKGRETPVAQIGLDLDVGYLLEGSARREGDRVRINATLIQVADQTQRWADSYDRPLTGVLALQYDVARGVAEALTLELLPAERARLAVARPVDADAYDAYQRGMSLLERATAATRQAALRAFELALERDPTFAPAYLGIRQAWAGLQQSGFVRPEEATPKMEAALDKALELDDTQPDAHYARATQATWTEWDWVAAERSFRRAIDLNPSHALARAFYSHYLHIMQRPDEAMAQLDVALQLDPLNPTFHGIAGGAYLMARRYDEALVHFREVLRLAPDSLQGLVGVANALHYAGRFEQALDAERELAAAGRGDPELAAALDAGYAENGYRGAMRRAADLLATRESTDYVAPNRVARYYFRAGEDGLALDWLERSYAARDPSLPYISSGHKDFDSVRADARFHELLRRMRLPPFTVLEQEAADAA